MSSMGDIQQELGWIIRLMESVSAKPGRSNGAVRWRLKLIEDELRELRPGAHLQNVTLPSPAYQGSRKMGRSPGSITYRRAIEMLERSRLTLIKISAQQEETNAELRLLITELATLLARDDGRSR